jgi:hypothetical protein
MANQVAPHALMALDVLLHFFIFVSHLHGSLLSFPSYIYIYPLYSFFFVCLCLRVVVVLGL